MRKRAGQLNVQNQGERLRDREDMIGIKQIKKGIKREREKINQTLRESEIDNTNLNIKKRSYNIQTV